MNRVVILKKASFVLLPLLVFAVYGGQVFGNETSATHAQTKVAEINPPMSIVTPQNA